MSERDPTTVRRRHRGMVAVALVTLGAMLTAGAFLLNERRAAEQARSVARNDLEQSADLMENAFDSAEEVATALAGFVMSSDAVEPGEMDLFAGGFLSKHPEIGALELLDYASGSGPPTLELRLRTEQVSGPADLDLDRPTRADTDGDRYVTTSFEVAQSAEPVARRADLSGERDRPGLGPVNPHLVDRLVTGSTGGSTVVSIVPREDGEADGGAIVLRLLRPIFDHGKPLDAPEDRAAALVGVASVVVSPKEVFSSVVDLVHGRTDLVFSAPGMMAGPPPPDDMAGPPPPDDGAAGGPPAAGRDDPLLLAGFVDGQSIAAGDHSEGLPLATSSLETSIPVGDRELTLVGSPSAELVASSAPWGPGWIPVIGMLLTAAVVAGYIWWSRVRRLERLAGALEDANERLELNAAEMRRVAEEDRLTGLPNRYSMYRMVEEAVTAPGDREVAVVLVDLDRFKEINHSLGHSRGDELLQLVSKRLAATVRSGSLGCMGGDEFCVLLTDVAPEQAAAVAERLVSTIRRPFRVGDRTVSLTASAAVCSTSAGEYGAEDLMERATVALNAAKAEARDTWVAYDSSIAALQDRRRSIAQELRLALDGYGNAVLTHFQPKVDLATGRIVSAEGLARWQHPAFGQVSPVEFIEVAEQMGLIVGLGAIQIQRAVDLLARCSAEGLELDSVSINVSAQQFGDEAMATRLGNVLEEAGVPAGSLVLEITESEAMAEADYGTVQDTMATLAAMGVRLSIDDFGTGYSSMSRIERLPVHEVKVDQSFVAGLPNRQASVGITRAILSLAHSLGIRVVAEGVETTDQRDWLIAERCDLAQGWLYAKAMDAERFLDALRAQRQPPGGPQPEHSDALPG